MAANKPRTHGHAVIANEREAIQNGDRQGETPRRSTRFDRARVFVGRRV